MFFFLLLLLQLTLVGTSPVSAQEMTRRQAGDLAMQISAGVVNGARAGVANFVLDRLALEASIGILRVQLIEAGGAKTYTSGYSATLGFTWYTHRDDMVSPLISVQGCYVRADAARLDQQRMAAILALGTEYAPIPSLSVHFRFGPAFQTIWARGGLTTETTAQFDAGISVGI